MEYEGNTSCALCGAELNMDRAREIYDGFICENCQNKLSPFMTELDLEEIEDLEEQIDLRRENIEKLRSFKPTRCFHLPEMEKKVYLDDENKTFLVTGSEDILSENPEIISLEDVLDASLEVQDEIEEVRDSLFRYQYELSVLIDLDHTYLSQIRVPLTKKPLSFESTQKSFLGFGGFDPSKEPSYQRLEIFGEDLSDALSDLEDEINHCYDVKPGEFFLGEKSGETIQPLLKEEVKESPAIQRGTIFCPWCGKKTHITENSRCEHCGKTF